MVLNNCSDQLLPLPVDLQNWTISDPTRPETFC